MARRFKVGVEQIDQELGALLTRMGVEEWWLSGAVKEVTRRRKMVQVLEKTGPITIHFRRDGEEFSYPCARFESALDNYRAVHLAIGYLWRIYEDYGIGTDNPGGFRSWFGGVAQTFVRLSLPDGGARPWWEELHVPRTATPEQINAVWRELAQRHHPDKPGGDATLMARINAARDQGLAERRG